MTLEASLQWLEASELALKGVGRIEAGPNGGYKYETMILMHSLMCCQLLSKADDLGDAGFHALHIVLPPAYCKHIQIMLRGGSMPSSWGSFKVPKKASIHYYRLALDVALMLLKQFTVGKFLRFGWADSSPQKRKDWLLSAYDEILESRLVPAFRAFQSMCRARHDERSGRPLDVEFFLEQAAIIASVISRHDDPPSALGSGATNLANKCASLSFKWWLQSGNLPKLQEFVASFKSFCADLGTEIGTVEFRMQGLRSLLPTWLQLEGLEADTDTHVGDGQFDLESDLMEDAPPIRVAASASAADSQILDDTSFLPNALTIPGALHLINNLLKEVSFEFVGWDDFLSQLKHFALLWRDGRLERYFRYCLHGTSFADKADEFTRSHLGSLHMDRWSEVVSFCTKLEVVLPTLRQPLISSRLISSHRISHLISSHLISSKRQGLHGIQGNMCMATVRKKLLKIRSSSPRRLPRFLKTICLLLIFR